ncbi:hypothetical protein ACTXOR_02320 [Arthrobacter rhombi]|uniref:hypothetical protein n=1 Tax=Arthrobacter rhombi TaxID=71253 RepID=UPI003FD61882
MKNIPENGTTLTTPIPGWRTAHTDGNTIHGFQGGRTQHAGQCGTTGPHPSPDCQCGIRVVEELTDLSEYIERALTYDRTLGRKNETPLSLVLLRVEASGLAARGKEAPVDPPGCIRAETVRLLDVYTPTHLDPDALNIPNGVPVHGLDTIPTHLFPTMRGGTIPDSPNRIDKHGDTFAVIVGDHSFSIRRAELNEPVMRAVFDMLTHRYETQLISVPKGKRLWDLIIGSRVEEPDESEQLLIAYGAAELMASMVHHAAWPPRRANRG